MLAREAGCLAAALRGLHPACDRTPIVTAIQRLATTATDRHPSTSDAPTTREYQQRGRQRRGLPDRRAEAGLPPEQKRLAWGQELVTKGAPSGSLGRSQSLPHRNAPPQVLQLIGDPRTGVADDTSTKPWGEMTVDLVHEAARSQVSWYKYDLAGNELHDTHRDARLSDYTRNLIYLLRAKDPARWTIPKLAAKFAVRPQRVLAILANKEMEAQALARGEALPGALRGYALPVHLHDLHLRPDGHPLDFMAPLPADTPAAANKAAQVADAAAADRTTLDTAGSSVAGSTARPASSSNASGSGGSSLGSISDFLDLEPGEQLPSAHHLPAADEDLAAASSHSLPAAVAAAQEQASALAAALRGALGPHGFSLQRLRAALEGQLAQAEAFCQQHFADRPDVAAALDLPARRAQVERVVEALAPLCCGEGLRLQGDVERLKGLAQQLQALQPAADGAGELEEGQRAQLEAATAEVAALLPEGATAAEVRRLVVLLDREQRRAVLEGVEAWSTRLHEAGVDVAALIAMGDRYTVPGGGEGSGAGAGAQQAPVFGGVEVGAGELQALADALVGVAAGSEALQADAQRVAGAVTELRRLWWEYLSAHEVGSDLLAAWGLIVPDDQDAIAAVAKGTQAAEEAEAAAEGAGEEPAKPSQRFLERCGADHLAAYLDYCVAGRVFDRGSGERHFVRLPTYPAFEGAPIRMLDEVRENEVSMLNREVAKAEDAALFRQFQDALVHNLGLNEELQGQPGMAVAQQPKKGWSFVVHPFGSSRPLDEGVPSTYVVGPGQAVRGLNELEQQYLRSISPKRRRRGVR